MVQISPAETTVRAGVYLAPMWEDVPRLMRDLVAWAAGPGLALPGYLFAGVLAYQFVTIHPFHDGNGRTARLVDTSGPGFVDTPPVLGDLIELSPGMINHICIMYCNDSATGYGTPTISQIHVIPRWLTA